MLERKITHSTKRQVTKSFHLKILLTFLTFLFLFFTLSTARADNKAPKMINLQAVLVDDGGNVLFDLQEADITFSIIDGAGAIYYQEKQHVPVVGGAISVLVGSGTPAEGFAEGGIPYDAIDPDGSRLLRIKLDDSTIPQEDLEFVSVPYSYYAQYALNVDPDAIESPHILDGTIQQADLSSDLLTYIDTSMEGVSQADLDEHKAESGAHTAGVIAVKNSFKFASGSDLQSILEGFDNWFSILDGSITSILTGGALDGTYLRLDSGNTMSGDLNMGGNNITNISNVDGVNVSALEARVDNLEDGTTLDNRYVNVGGDTMTGDLTMNGGDIVMSGSETVDGVDVSALETTVNNHETRIFTLENNVQGKTFAYGTMNGSSVSNSYNMSSSVSTSGSAGSFCNEGNYTYTVSFSSSRSDSNYVAVVTPTSGHSARVSSKSNSGFSVRIYTLQSCNNISRTPPYFSGMETTTGSFDFVVYAN